MGGSAERMQMVALGLSHGWDGEEGGRWCCWRVCAGGDPRARGAEDGWDTCWGHVQVRAIVAAVATGCGIVFAGGRGGEGACALVHTSAYIPVHTSAYGTGNFTWLGKRSHWRNYWLVVDTAAVGWG